MQTPFPIVIWDWIACVMCQISFFHIVLCSTCFGSAVSRMPGAGSKVKKRANAAVEFAVGMGHFPVNRFLSNLAHHLPTRQGFRKPTFRQRFFFSTRMFWNIRENVLEYSLRNWESFGMFPIIATFLWFVLQTPIAATFGHSWVFPKVSVQSVAMIVIHLWITCCQSTMNTFDLKIDI